MTNAEFTDVQNVLGRETGNPENLAQRYLESCLNLLSVEEARIKAVKYFAHLT